MYEERYRGGEAERPTANRRPDRTPHPMEKRYATLGTRQNRERTDRNRADRNRDERGRDNEERWTSHSPLVDIARYDERHHYGRHSVERRQERVAEQRRNREQDHEPGESSRPEERRYHRYGTQF